jgi:hypothetical protein
MPEIGHDPLDDDVLHARCMKLWEHAGDLLHDPAADDAKQIQAAIPGTLIRIDMARRDGCLPWPFKGASGLELNIGEITPHDPAHPIRAVRPISKFYAVWIDGEEGPWFHPDFVLYRGDWEETFLHADRAVVTPIPTELPDDAA